MEKPQYAILRFAKYKGPEIGGIEAHDERTKEKYASNPDVDISRSRLNFHLVKPQRSYRAEAEKQIAEAGCRARKDSVRVVETLITASPDFERGESASETGRTHIPPRLFKEAVRLNRQKDKIARLLSEITPLNAKKKSVEIEAILDDYIPSVEKLMTRMKKANSAVKKLNAEIAALKQEVNSSKASIQRQLELTRKVQELDDLRKFFPKSYTPARIQERILKLLEADCRKRQLSRGER